MNAAETDDLEDLRLRALARLEHRRRDARDRYTAHPWPFVSECAVTLDQIVGAARPFPADATDPHPECACGGCGSYTHHLVNTWHATPRLLIPKSRRMVVTWTMLACHWWLARFRPGSRIAIGARKLGKDETEGSNELVRRIKWLEDHIPPQVAPMETHRGVGRIEYPTINSEIVAVAEGADQLRQYTVTAFLGDEMAFWEEAEGTYSASIPTLEGGGRFTGLSSAHPGFFKLLVHDQLDSR